MTHTGRFAPSPTGPLHLGSLVAAVGSRIFARRNGGQWLVRMEDLDTPRVVPGSAEGILETLLAYGLTWDGEIVYQSQRIALYERALHELREKGLVYDCGCSRAESEAVYPGTCRNGIRSGRVARSMRFRVPDEVIGFDDLLKGRYDENVAQATGDFIVKRADGIFAYQLAVVVDDAEQRITQVVRGEDLLSSTPRQIALQRALGLPTPEYAHMPLALTADGRKISKSEGGVPIDPARVEETLEKAYEILGFR
jgi:glutamyl-Q tRNA(Asp) synthetase